MTSGLIVEPSRNGLTLFKSVTDAPEVLPRRHDTPHERAEASARRRAALDRVELRASERRVQESLHRAAQVEQVARLKAEDRERAETSVPPPGWDAS